MIAGIVTLTRDVLITLAAALSQQTLLDAQRNCVSADAERRVSACTAIINNKQTHHTTLSWAYYNRGVARIGARIGDGGIKF